MQLQQESYGLHQVSLTARPFFEKGVYKVMEEQGKQINFLSPILDGKIARYSTTE